MRGNVMTATRVDGETPFLRNYLVCHGEISNNIRNKFVVVILQTVKNK